MHGNGHNDTNDLRDAINKLNIRNYVKRKLMKVANNDRKITGCYFFRSTSGSNQLSSLLGRICVYNTHLKVIDLSFCNIDIRGLAPLCDGLSHNKSIQKVFLNGNNFQETKCCEVLKILFTKNNSIRLMNLSYCTIGTDGLALLCSGLICNDTLQDLCIGEHSFCGIISDNYVATITDMIKVNRGIRKLTLHGWNDISDEVVSVLFDGLERNNHVKELHLSESNIGNCGIICVGKMLKTNKSIRVLRLGRSASFDENAKKTLLHGLSDNYFIEDLLFYDHRYRKFVQPLEEFINESTFYLGLNKFTKRGQFFAHNNEMSTAEAGIPTSLWPLILAKVSSKNCYVKHKNNISDHDHDIEEEEEATTNQQATSSLFWFVRSKPDLFISSSGLP